ncbi:MAG: hypothetical protein U5L09_15035 [Bacteroidales bacterium]|nr:hypothetical protein [Bacteroidales bacterium]
MQPSLTLPTRVSETEQLTIGSSFNTISGLKNINLNIGMQHNLGNYNANFNSFADKSYNPNIKFPMVSTHGTFTFSAGAEIFGTYTSGKLSAYYSQQHLKTRHISVPAYGYMYTDAADNSPKALLDYKRENEGRFMAEQPNLPIPNYTYDVFNVSGSGISGSFRAHRGDVGVLYDHRTKSLGGDKAVAAVGGFDISAELGAGNLVKVGVDLKTNNSENTSGLWSNSNQILDMISPVSQASRKDYEPFYFRMSGEKQVQNNHDYYKNIMGRDAASVALSSISKGTAYNILETKGVDSKEIKNPVYKKNREKRIQTVSYLTAKDAQRLAISRNINNYPLNKTPLDLSNVSTLKRLNNRGRSIILVKFPLISKGNVTFMVFLPITI